MKVHDDSARSDAAELREHRLSIENNHTRPCLRGGGAWNILVKEGLAPAIMACSADIPFGPDFVKVLILRDMELGQSG